MNMDMMQLRNDLIATSDISKISLGISMIALIVALVSLFLQFWTKYRLVKRMKSLPKNVDFHREMASCIRLMAPPRIPMRPQSMTDHGSRPSSMRALDYDF